MGTITATFSLDGPGAVGDVLARFDGQRVEVLGDAASYGNDTASAVRFPDGFECAVFNDELTEWRLEA